MNGLKKNNIELLACYAGFFLFLCFVFLEFYRPIEISDIWWHLATGRWIFHHQQIPQFDIFSPLENPSPFILNQSIGSCIYYAVYYLSGFLGLKLFRFVVFAGILGLLYWRSRKNIPHPFLILFLIVLTFLLASRAHLRPYIFNFLFIPAYLILLFDHQKGSHKKKIYIIPLLSVIWGNLHLGCFFFGYIMIGVFLLSHVVHYIDFKNSKQANGQNLAGHWAKVKDLFFIICGHTAALMVNPFGLAGFLYPFKAFFDQDFYINKHLANVILELSPPIYIFSWRGIWVYILIAMTVLSIVKIKNFKWTHVLLFVISLFLFLYSHRGIGFFTLCCAMIIIEGCENGWLSRWWNSSRSKRLIGPVLSVGIFLILIFNIAHLYNQKIYKNGRLSRSIHETFHPLTPVDLVSTLQKYGIKGNIFNWDGCGGYLIWRSYPDIKPLADTRQADPEIFFDYTRAVRNFKEYWGKIEMKYELKAAIINPNFGNQHDLLDYLLENPRWTMISLIGPSVLMVNAGEGTFPQQMKNYRQSLMNIPAPDLRDLAAAASKPKNILAALPQFLKGDIVYNQDLEEAIVLFTHDFRNAGLTKLAEANKRVDDRNVLNIYRLTVNVLAEEAIAAKNASY